MDIIKMLSDLKGKALDAFHFDLLKSAYELQDKNIKQLKNNNEAIKEDNSHLKEKILCLESENNESREQNMELMDRIKDQTDQQNSDKQISINAKAILAKCKEQDITKFSDNKLFECVGIKHIEFEAALGELSNNKLIRVGSYNMYSGETFYSMTQSGKELLLKLE